MGLTSIIKETLNFSAIPSSPDNLITASHAKFLAYLGTVTKLEVALKGQMDALEKYFASKHLVYDCLENLCDNFIVFDKDNDDDDDHTHETFTKIVKNLTQIMQYYQSPDSDSASDSTQQPAPSSSNSALFYTQKYKSYIIAFITLYLTTLQALSKNFKTVHALKLQYDHYRIKFDALYKVNPDPPTGKVKDKLDRNRRKYEEAKTFYEGEGLKLISAVDAVVDSGKNEIRPVIIRLCQWERTLASGETKNSAKIVQIEKDMEVLSKSTGGASGDEGGFQRISDVFADFLFVSPAKISSVDAKLPFKGQVYNGEGNRGRSDSITCLRDAGDVGNEFYSDNSVTSQIVDRSTINNAAQSPSASPPPTASDESPFGKKKSKFGLGSFRRTASSTLDSSSPSSLSSSSQQQQQQQQSDDGSNSNSGKSNFKNPFSSKANANSSSNSSSFDFQGEIDAEKKSSSSNSNANANSKTMIRKGSYNTSSITAVDTAPSNPFGNTDTDSDDDDESKSSKKKLDEKSPSPSGSGISVSADTGGSGSGVKSVTRIFRRQSSASKSASGSGGGGGGGSFNMTALTDTTTMTPQTQGGKPPKPPSPNASTGSSWGTLANVPTTISNSSNAVKKATSASSLSTIGNGNRNVDWEDFDNFAVQTQTQTQQPPAANDSWGQFGGNESQPQTQQQQASSSSSGWGDFDNNAFTSNINVSAQPSSQDPPQKKASGMGWGAFDSIPGATLPSLSNLSTTPTPRPVITRTDTMDRPPQPNSAPPPPPPPLQQQQPQVIHSAFSQDAANDALQRKSSFGFDPFAGFDDEKGKEGKGKEEAEPFDAWGE